jgi:ArsR family transcriptional regulator, arsenate/arsenite/antimonite-responsive transcriptional repressor
VSSLSDLCKALGDETRLQMLQLLAVAKRPLCACELESQFDLSQPTVSHHLRILRRAGVVSATRRGTWVFYEMNAKPLKLLRKLDKLLCAGSCGGEPACKTRTETRHDGQARHS